MSGGSHDYLFTVIDADDLCRKRIALEGMAELLSESPWPEAKPAAVETLRLLSALRRLDAFVQASAALKDVWHDVEWWTSCDYSEDQARDALRKFAELSEL